MRKRMRSLSSTGRTSSWCTVRARVRPVHGQRVRVRFRGVVEVVVVRVVVVVLVVVVVVVVLLLLSLLLPLTYGPSQSTIGE